MEGDKDSAGSEVDGVAPPLVELHPLDLQRRGQWCLLIAGPPPSMDNEGTATANEPRAEGRAGGHERSSELSASTGGDAAVRGQDGGCAADGEEGRLSCEERKGDDRKEGGVA